MYRERERERGRENCSSFDLMYRESVRERYTDTETLRDTQRQRQRTGIILI